MAGDAGAALAELERTIRRFGEAWACGDVAVLDELLSPTYTHIDAYGDFRDHASWLAYAGRRAGRTTREGRWRREAFQATLAERGNGTGT